MTRTQGLTFETIHTRVGCLFSPRDTGGLRESQFCSSAGTVLFLRRWVRDRSPSTTLSQYPGGKDVSPVWSRTATTTRSGTEF